MVRPTRLGRAQPILTYALGYTPDADLGDEPDPVDQALGAAMYIPFTSPEPAGELVQWAQAVGVGSLSVVMGQAVTAGHLLVLGQWSTANGAFPPSGFTSRQFGAIGASARYMGLADRVAQSGDGDTFAVGAADAVGRRVVLMEWSGLSAPDSISTGALANGDPTNIDPGTGIPIGLIAVDSDLGGRRVNVVSPSTEVFAGAAQIGPPYGSIGYSTEDDGLDIHADDPVISFHNNEYIVGNYEVDANPLMWLVAFATNDDDDATYEYVATRGPDGDVLRVDVGEARRFGSARLVIATTDAGSVEYAIEGSDSDDFTGAVELASETFTATGSFTAQTVTFAWVQTTGYRYYRLVTAETDDVRVYTFSLYEAEDGGVTDHPSLTGRDTADQHPASAVSFTPAGTIAATNVQAAIEEVAAEAGSGDMTKAVYDTDNDGKVDIAETVQTAEALINSLGDGNAINIRSVTTNTFTRLLVQPNGTPAVGDTAIHLYYDRGANERFLGIGANHGADQYLIASGDANTNGDYLPILFMMEDGVTQLPVMRMNTDRTVEFWFPLLLQEGAAPGTPAAGKASLYVKTDGKVYLKNDAGIEYDLTSAAPTGAAGGDLSGTYPNPSVVDDSHNHTSATVPAGGEILITDTPAGSPLVFADLLQNEAGTDLLYSD